MRVDSKKTSFKRTNSSYKPLLKHSLFQVRVYSLVHGGGFPMINSSGDKKVRVWWYGRRKRARDKREREREREREGGRERERDRERYREGWIARFKKKTRISSVPICRINPY